MQLLPHDFLLHSIMFALSGDPPDWVPYPIGNIGQFRPNLDAPEVITEHRGSLDELTKEWLLTPKWWIPGDPPFVMVDPANGTPKSVEISETTLETIRAIEQKTNEILSETAPEMPTLMLRLKPPSQWMRGLLVEWSAIDRGTSEQVSIDELSEAQRRWSSIAIQAALWTQGTYSFHAAMLVEEPELGLHASAVTQVANALAAEALSGLPTFVTSHSSAFLNAPGASLIHILRDPEKGGLAVAEPMEESIKYGLHRAITRLGLDRAGALQLHRVLLLVEGQHDRIVLEETFSDEWARHRIRLLSMGGSHATLSVAGCEALLTFSDADIVVVLDNATLNRIPEVWAEARGIALKGDISGARRRLHKAERDLARRLTQEERAAISFALAAVGSGPDRFHLFGLKERDVITYLDVAHLVPGATSWQVLDKEYRSYKKDPTAKKSFKEWAKTYRQGAFTTKRIREAARSLADKPPPEFSQLLALCVDLAKRERTSSEQRHVSG
jgi:hypothetical protein